MTRLCILPCGSRKVWDKFPATGPTPARDAYIGTFHRACQAYAVRFFPQWVILSAKHGFLLPDDIVPENYDVAFDSKKLEIISTDELRQQMTTKGLENFEQVIVLGGKKYRKVVQSLFDDKQLRYPLKKFRGIGYMVQALHEAVGTGAEIQER